jgi:hypothetical protein
MAPLKWKKIHPGMICRTYPGEIRFAFAITAFTGTAGQTGIPAFHSSILMAQTGCR